MTTLLDDVLVPTKLVLIGIALGAVSGLALAQFNPGPSLAAVAASPPFSIGSALDDTHLAKFDGDYFAVQTAPGTSLEPESSVAVKKIGYGQVSYANIVATPSGVYSSDSLASGHVRYAGIEVVPLHIHIFPLTGRVLGWSRLTGWTEIPLLGANSIGFLDTASQPASADGVCVKDTATGGCR